MTNIPDRPTPRNRLDYDQRPQPPLPRPVKLEGNKIWLGFQIGIGIILAVLITGPVIAVLSALFWVFVLWRITG